MTNFEHVRSYNRTEIGGINMKNIYVALGGFIGAGGRYWIGIQFPQSYTIAGTFLVNVFGCLLIGLVYEWISKKNRQGELWLFLGTGFCGGLTTMSTFSSELGVLFQTGQYLLFGSYLFATWIVGILFTLLGMKMVFYCSRIGAGGS